MAEVDTIDIPDVTPVTRTVATVSKLIKTAGLPADAAATQTDTTSVSHTSILKQISKSIQLFVFGAGTAAAAQRTTLASDDPAVATLGAVAGTKVITDANGTLQQYLRGLVTLWIGGLAAGANLIGKVGIDQTTPGTTDSVSVKSQAFSAAVALTRTADTNAYAANDVIGAATGSTAALTFASMGPSGKEIMITSVALEIDAAAIISGETSYRLYLYNVTPPSALGDNAAWDLPAGDRASFLGYVDLGSPVDLGSTLYAEASGINKQVLLSGTSLFGYLVTNGAYTPTSARVHKITLHTIAP